MNRSITAAAALFLVAACKKAEPRPSAEAAAVPHDSFTVADSFKTPESVLYDSVMDVYIVSNINGAPGVKDNNGFLSRVGTDGRVVELHWVDAGRDSVTLNAPKGMGIRGDTLFVADIDAVRMFDRTSGHPLGSLPIAGATFLNDIDVGPDGSVYVSDTGVKADFSPAGTDAVYVRHGSPAFRALARGRALGGPNGVLADSTGVTVVTFGSGEAYHLDLQGRRTPLPKPPHGQLDGVVRMHDGSLLISSWADSSVVMMAPGSMMYAVVERNMPSPADIGWDARRHRLLIPIFTQNRIEVRPVGMGMAASAHAQ